jgi:hypothetical protein
MKPDPRDTASPRERFLTRWSRLKRTGASPADAAPASPQAPSTIASSASATPAAAANAATPSAMQSEVVESLPPIESLSIESDFSPFFQPKVPDALRRAAVKKLFADPRFNVMDGLDVYIDDYSKPDPIPPEMLKNLLHARDLIDHPSDRLAREQAAAATPAGEDAATGGLVADAAASESANDSSDAAPAEPPLAHRSDDAIAPAEAGPASSVTTRRPADAG